jgi:transketolase
MSRNICRNAGISRPTFKESAASPQANSSIRSIKSCPFAFGGSADVAASVMTNLPDDPDFSSRDHPEGRDVNWGIREFAMAGAQNGIQLHKGLKTYVGCFLIFSDYMKSAIRMSCLEKIPAIYLFSHDSIAVGEDGPTHEPIEQLAMLRSIPGLDVIRPADAKETYAAWTLALKQSHVPTAIILSRQSLPLLPGSSLEGVEKGAYIVSKAAKKPDYQIIATGSEVSLAIAVQGLLAAQGIQIEVVSMPSWERFEAQDKAYQASVLHLPYEKRISLEMASTFGWTKFAKTNLGIDEFGASAPAAAVLDHFGFTPEKIVAKLQKELLAVAK